MKILLTGKPGSGKSTVIAKFIDTFSGKSKWVKTEEIRNETGDRVGFRAVNSTGRTEIISHKFDINSPYLVGANRVDLPKIDEMFTVPLAGSSNDELVIVDEIGPIQMLSDNFKKELDRLFLSEKNLLATIHYKDDQVRKYREDNNVIVLEVTDVNRDLLPNVLINIFENTDKLGQLTDTQRVSVVESLKTYLSESKFIEARKLFKNVLIYLLESRIKPLDGIRFEVSGNHGKYVVTNTKGGYKCECDFFLGRNSYKEAGECSHIQAVKLLDKTNIKTKNTHQTSW